MLGPMRRLWQTVRPIRFRLYLGLLSAMTASIVALMIPQVLEFIVNRLETDAVAAIIWTGRAVVLGLGFLEASLIWMPGPVAVTPSITVENQTRLRRYAQAQHLPVAFPDGWLSLQLLPLALTDRHVHRLSRVG